MGKREDHIFPVIIGLDKCLKMLYNPSNNNNVQGLWGWMSYDGVCLPVTERWRPHRGKNMNVFIRIR